MTYSWTILTKQAIEQQTQDPNKNKTGIETTKNGYLFRDAFSAFRDALKKQNEKKAHYWLAELCISGEVKKTWQMILNQCVLVIPFVDPKEMIRLYRRVLRVKQKIERKESTDITILHMLHDCLIILMWAQKQKHQVPTKFRKILSKIKVPQDPRNYRKAPLDSIHPIVLGTLSHANDPPNLIAGGHEIIHAVLRGDIEMIQWWLSWIILWTPADAKGRPRPHRIVNTKYEKDWIWGVWDLVFALSQHMRLPNEMKTVIRHCQSLFAVDYTVGNKKKRFSLLLLAFYICSTDKWKPITMPHLSDRIMIGLGLKNFYKSIMLNRQMSG